MMKINRIAKIIIFSLAPFYIFLLDNSPTFDASDANTYILLAKSISLGQGYREIWLPASPKYIKAHLVFPLLLSPTIYFFGYNFLMMKLLSTCMAVGSLWLVYLLFKRLSDESLALLILILTGFCAQFVYFSQKILTEIPYLFFSLLTLIFIGKSEEKKHFFNKNLFLAIFFVLLSYFTRYIAISLITTIFIYFLFAYRFDKNLRFKLKNLIFLGLFISAPMLLWRLRSYNAEESGQRSYLQIFLSTENPLDLTENLNFLERIIHSVYAYTFYAYPKILTGIQFCQRNPIAFILSAITLCGFWHCLVKKRKPSEYYIILYMALLFCYSTSITSGARYIVPIIPFIFYYFITGLRKLLESAIFIERIRKWLLISSLATLLFFNIKESASFAIDRELLRGYSTKEYNDLYDMSKWIKYNTVVQSIFGTFMPNFVYLFFGRKAVAIPYNPPALAKELDKIIHKNKVDYIFLDFVSLKTIGYATFKIVNESDRLIKVYQSNGNAIYKVIETKEDR